MKNLIVQTPKPRNPLVAPCMRRKAGAHGANRSALRQRAGRELRAELLRLKPPRPE